MYTGYGKRQFRGEQMMQRKLWYLIGIAVMCVSLVLAGCGGSEEFAPVEDMAVDTMAHPAAYAMPETLQVKVRIVGIDMVAPDGQTVTVVDWSAYAPSFDLVTLAKYPFMIGGPAVVAGDYSQMRLRVSDEPGSSYVVTADGVRHDLKVPGTSGIKLQTNDFTVAEGATLSLQIGFNSATSVHLTQGGTQWQLKPSIPTTVETL